MSGQQLAARLEKVTERLAADATNMERSGAELIAHYLGPDRLPADRRWSRKHAHTQRSLRERFAALSGSKNGTKLADLVIGRRWAAFAWQDRLFVMVRTLYLMFVRLRG